MNSLRSFRKSLNLTLKEFAKNIGVSTSLYSKVEQGVRKPSRRFTEKLKETYPQFDINILYEKN